MVDGDGHVSTYVYDGYDRLSQLCYPNATTCADYVGYGYDANSNVTSVRQRDGSTNAYAYDALGRLASISGGGLDRSYSYDLLGDLLYVHYSSTGQGMDYSYDILGRRLTQTNDLGTMSSQYDLAGRRTRLTWPDGFYVTYDYDAADEMTAVRENGAASGVGVLATFGYDNQGRRIGMNRGNGAPTGYAYDGLSRLTGMGSSGTSSNQVLNFSYNPAGQITGRTDTNGAYHFAATNLDQTYLTNVLNQYYSVAGTALS